MNKGLPGGLLASLMILVPTAHSSSAPILTPPIHWIRLSGAPRDNCLRPSFEIHVTPAYSLSAVSKDKTRSWAVTADQRGLSVLACKDNHIQSTTMMGPLSGDRVVTIANALQEVTACLFQEPETAASERTTHSDEVRGLQGELVVFLPQLIKDSRKRFPGFLDQPPVILIPTP